jgi:hypothetical protein
MGVGLVVEAMPPDGKVYQFKKQSVDAVAAKGIAVAFKQYKTGLVEETAIWGKLGKAFIVAIISVLGPFGQFPFVASTKYEVEV